MLNGIKERWTTLRSSAARLFVIFLTALTVVGLYETFISEVWPEGWFTHPPKFSMFIKTAFSLLPLSGWFFITFGATVAVLFEHIHRERVSAPSITPLSLLIIVGAMALIGAISIHTMISPNISRIVFIGPPHDFENSKRVTAALQESHTANHEIDKFIAYFADRKKIETLQRLQSNLPIAITNQKSMMCSLVNSRRGGFDLMLHMHDMFITMSDPDVSAAISKTGGSSVVPANLMQLRAKFISALSLPSNPDNDTKLQLARVRYAESCDVLEDNLRTLSNQTAQLLSDLQNKILQYEHLHDL